jgi:Leucine rich repeat
MDLQEQPLPLSAPATFADPKRHHKTVLNPLPKRLGLSDFTHLPTSGLSEASCTRRPLESQPVLDNEDNTVSISGQVISDAYLVTDDDSDDRITRCNGSEKPAYVKATPGSWARFVFLGFVLLLLIAGIATGVVFTQSRSATRPPPGFRPTTAPSAPGNQTSIPSLSPSILTIDRFIDMNLPKYDENDTADFSPLQTARNSAVKWLNEETTDFLMMELSQQKQRYSLAVFYMATTLQPWQNSTGWLSPDNECTWFSVQDDVCNDDLLYTTLQLSDNNLWGQLPEEIELLSHLEVFDLRSNAIRGVLPNQIGSLTHLKVIELSYNQLSSTIPSSFGNMTSLETLLIRSSNLTGTIPTPLFNAGRSAVGSSSLAFVDLSGNKITGSVPSSIGNARNLSHLSLEANQLTGQLPSEIGMLTKLSSLSIASNSITGSLPTEM